MATGDNLAACQERGIELFSPIKGQNTEDNPALRDDPTEPVADADRDRLPTTTVTRKGGKQQQLAKQAFVYDDKQDCYWCPAGKQLPYANTTSEKRNGGRRVRRRYHASAGDCAECPLRARCLQGEGQRRTINREQHESLREAHAVKMSTDDARKQYARKQHAGERPFAVIKHKFGARRFLLRGLSQVKQEWHWLAIAFNLDRLFGLLKSGTGPPAAQT